ncbi:MAG: TolC family protein, partial [Lentisphaeraceae bacterium]|nr:TolC family protein [Lentisphaeraceae bacterium]
MTRVLTIIFLSLGIFSGCKALHHPKPKKIVVNDLPEKWTNGKETAGSTNGWVSDFDDKQLPLIVNEAVENNFDLRVSAARLEEAFALARIAGADRLPSLSLDGSAGRSRSGQGDIRQHSNEYSLFLRFDWELDVWGKLKDRKLAAEADVRAEFFTFHAARLSLANAVSRFWFNAVEAKLQLMLAEETEKSFQNTFEIIDERFKKGISEALDVRLATIDLANARQNTQQRKADFDAAVRALEVLLGRYPAGELKISQTLPEIKESIPLGLPAEMLNRRPDILASLQNLEAASLRVSENKKELLPG